MAHRPQLPTHGTGTPGATRRRAALAVLALLVSLVVAACSGGLGSSSSDAGSDGGGEAAPAEAERAAGRGADLKGLGGSASDGDAGAPARVPPMTRQVIRTGELTLQAEDVAGLREEVDRLVQRYGGYVASERSFTDDEGRLVEDRLVLRIPVQRFDQVRADFAEVATVLAPRTRTEDVTTEVIDVDSRVRTAEVSLERLRSFLRRSDDVNAMIRLEAEMADREADLASLRAQQDYLEDQTSLATITVTLQRPPEEEPGDRPGEDGFLAGLYSGWDALKGVVVVAATILGAVLPFALVAGLVGVPLALAARAARRRRPASAGPATPPAPSTPA